MPLYDVVCENCKFEETILSKPLADIPVCPKCDSERAKKFTPPQGLTFDLKGGGYYITDFKK